MGHMLIYPRNQYFLVQKIPMNLNNLLLHYKISSVYNAKQEFANCEHCKSTVAFESLGGFPLPPLRCCSQSLADNLLVTCELERNQDPL